MYKNLISKNLNHFGNEGIIMYSKSCDYYNINQISIEDVKMFYNLLKSNEPLPSNMFRQPLLSCCLFYLSKNSNQYRDVFSLNLIHKLSLKDEVNDTNLFLIYNIIEFDQRYLHSKPSNLKFLLSYLEKFSSHKKTVENYLLYKYYRGILKYLLNEINDAYTEYLEIIIGIEEYVTKKTKYVDFIRLKNDLFKVQLDLSKHIKEEYFEQYCFMKELFDKVKNENKKLGIKLGFCLYEILCRQNKFNECIPLLMEMKKILKNETLSGVNLKISIDYYLSIASRIGFISVLIGNKKAAEYAVKKLNKILGIIQNDKGDKKLALIYKAYTFIISILNIDIGNYENKFKEKSIDFRNNFFPLNSEQKSINNYFVTLKNKDDLIIDLYSLNNMDYSLGTLANKIMENYTNITLAKKLLFTNQFLAFIVGIHNNINRLSESYCTDYNINKRTDYIKKIYNFYNIAFNYVKSVMDQEPLLETDFVKTILINIQATCAHVYLYNNKLDIVKNLVKFFDDLGKMLLIKDSTPSYELIYKVKGDFWLKKGDYSGAITYYQKVINKMETNNQKRPTIFFNLGYAYYLSGNRRNAIENLNQFINAYRVFDYEKKTFTLLIRQDVIAKKIKLIKYLLKNMSNN